MANKLSHEETVELLRSLPNEEAEALLMEDNEALVWYLSKKLVKRKGVDFEDILSVGRLGLLKAIRSFDTAKNVKLATYAARCITNEILMFFRKESKHENNFSLQDSIPNLKDDNLTFQDMLPDDKVNVEECVFDNIMISELLEGLTFLPDKQRLAMELSFGLNGNQRKTQYEVAEILGISQSYVSRMIKSSCRWLKEWYNSGKTIKYSSRFSAEVELTIDYPVINPHPESVEVFYIPDFYPTVELSHGRGEDEVRLKIFTALFRHVN